MMMGPPGPWGCPWPAAPPGWNEYLQAWSQHHHLAVRGGPPQAHAGELPRRVFAGPPDTATDARRSPERPDRSPSRRRSPASRSPPR
eukprot:1164144-Alexandrium_andersonii.AAC.1